jgi:hypothetical protein
MDVYNPRVAVRYEYRSLGRYHLDELEQALLEAIDKDDDVLTQFHDADDLQRRLGYAVSFGDVVEVLHHAATETDNDG